MAGKVRAVAKASAWIVVCTAAFIAAQYIVSYSIEGLFLLGVRWDVTSTTSSLVYRLFIYLCTALLIASVVLYRCHKVSFQDISLSRLLTWKDIGMSLAGIVIYMLLAMVSLGAAHVWFGVNTTQAQDLGFTQLSRGNLLEAFVVLVLLTPFFEEMLFRGFLYGRLRRVKVSWWIPAIVVSALFGLAHGQWNVGIDVFCLSMVACALRETTGSIWAGILLHMYKNMIAFLLTFVFVSALG